MYEIAVAAGSFVEFETTAERLAGTAIFSTVEVGAAAELATATAAADALIVTLQNLGREHIQALGPGVRVIGRAGIGLDTIDLSAAHERGIAVINQPDYATAEVATHAVTLLLAAHRRLLAADHAARGSWASWRPDANLVPIEEQTVGVLGCGRIGRAVLDRLRPFAGTLIAHDPQLSGTPESVEIVEDFERFVARCDILTVHVPLSASTRGLLDERTLKLLPPGAIVVNVSRGGIVDEGALVDAVQSGHLAGAALDVLSSEPPEPGSPVLAEPRILLTPHIAWHSSSSAVRLREQTCDSIVSYLAADPVIAGNVAVDPRT